MKLNDNIYQSIQSKKNGIAVLIDPEKQKDDGQLKQFIEKVNFAKIDYIFVGGSTVTREEIEHTLSIIKQNTSIPVLIFPGSSNQISSKADAMLYLSLLSGRNPDYLIGHHVQSANELYHMDIEIIPTAYLIFDGGVQTSVAYVSQTTPIPLNKVNIVKQTVMAAKMQGKSMVYLDAGSGAKETVTSEIIESIKQIDLPIIVGGGVRTADKIKQLHQAGANVVVIGNKLEECDDFLLELHVLKTNEIL